MNRDRNKLEYTRNIVLFIIFNYNICLQLTVKIYKAFRPIRTLFVYPNLHIDCYLLKNVHTYFIIDHFF